jgi:hypothetical protein
MAQRLEDVREHFRIPSIRAFHARLVEGWASDDAVSYEAVRNYHYDRDAPAAYLARVAKVFPGVRLEYLVTGDGEMTEEEEQAQSEVARVAAAVAPLEQLKYVVGAVHDALGVPRWTSRLHEVPAWGPLVLQTAQRLCAARASSNLRATGEMGDYELPEATADVASAISAPLQALGVNARYDLPDDERDTYVHATTLALQRAITGLHRPLILEDSDDDA